MTDKCIIKDCVNKRNEGGFVGDLCTPCYAFITRGEGKHSQAYRNALSTGIDYFLDKLTKEFAIDE